MCAPRCLSFNKLEVSDACEIGTCVPLFLFNLNSPIVEIYVQLKSNFYVLLGKCRNGRCNKLKLGISKSRGL
jgi:hypothetical protein